MTRWPDVYKVVAAMAPLYFALGLGYGSVRWKLFTVDQCDAVNRVVAYFAVPFFAFDFAARDNPFAMNYRVLAADAASKLAVALVLASWAAAARRGATKWKGRGSGHTGSWCVTGFSLATPNNLLVVGVPLLDAMYGKWGRDLVVQLSLVQAIVWFPLLLLAFEVRQPRAGMSSAAAAEGGARGEDQGGDSVPASDAEAGSVKNEGLVVAIGEDARFGSSS